MQISIDMLIIGAVHMLLLIGGVYMSAFLKLHYSARISIIDVFLLAIQVLDLIALPPCIIGQDSILPEIFRGHGSWLALQYTFAFIVLLRLLWLLRKARSLRANLLLPRSVRESIDYLPGGICFSTPDGRPVLSNYIINDVVYRLTGHTVLNAQLTWQELQKLDLAKGLPKLDNLRTGSDNENGVRDECLYFSLPDGSIWRFWKEDLTDREPHYTQLEAMDITKLYKYSNELYESNVRLTEQQRRWKDLLENIVEINHEKEILSAKMRIHDDLGRSILITKQHLSNQTLSDNLPYLTETWDSAIRRLTDFAHTDADSDISPEVELTKVAEMIGCSIVFNGPRPIGRKASLLLYAAVREALTNAVIHAKADRLNVDITPADMGYQVKISDNGAPAISSVKEGSGLSNLRRRLEQEGATLQVKCGGGVVLEIDLPSEI